MSSDLFHPIPLCELIGCFYSVYETGKSKHSSQFVQNWNKKGNSRLQIAKLLENLELQDEEKRSFSANFLLWICEGWTTLQLKKVSYEENIVFNNQLVKTCGALPLYIQYFLGCIETFKKDQSLRPTSVVYKQRCLDLHTSISLLYLLIVCNENDASFSRQLFTFCYQESPSLLRIMFNELRFSGGSFGYPTKRLLLLIRICIKALFGTTEDIKTIKKYRAKQNQQPFRKNFKSSSKDLEHQEYLASQMNSTLPSVIYQDKIKIIQNHLHIPHAELPSFPKKSKPQNKTQDPLIDKLQDPMDDIELTERCGLLYEDLLTDLKGISNTLVMILSICCASSLHAQDKMMIFSSFYAEDNSSDYWEWIKREKEIALSAVTEIFLSLLKIFRLHHCLEADYLSLILVKMDILLVILKFLNKDIATYVTLNTATFDGNGGIMNLRDAYMGLSLQADEESLLYSKPRCRILINVLRIMQRLTKKYPSRIRGILIKNNSFKCLKRIMTVSIAAAQIYSLKLIKHQIRYLGRDWLQSNMNIVTSIYYHILPQMSDNWLCFSDENEGGIDNEEEKMKMKMYAYHRNNYSYSCVDHVQVLPKKEPSTNEIKCMAVQNRLDLDADHLDLEGGALLKYYKTITLDPEFCKNYKAYLPFL